MIGAVHSVGDRQVVVRAVPAIINVELGPGLDAVKPLPSTSKREALSRAYVDARRMQRKNVASCGDRYVCRAGLCGVVRADGHHLQRVRRWRGTGRGVVSVCVDCAANAGVRARRPLNLPHHALVAGAKDRGRESLDRERRQRDALRRHRNQHMIDDRDLR